MKIIKEGDLNRLKKIKRFECKECGCVFKAEKDEYKLGNQYNDEYYYCKCPCCHQIVYKGYK